MTQELINSPGFLPGHSTLGSDVSYFFAITFASLFLYSGSLASKGMGRKHHYMMLVSMVAMMLYFAFYYEVRKLGVISLVDQLGFRGPQFVYRYIFHPILFAHFIAVTVSTFLAVYMIGNGFRTAVYDENRIMTLKSFDVVRSKVLWLAGFLWLGFLLWLLFSLSKLGVWHKLLLLSLGYFIPAGVALLIGKTLPDSGRRHRMLGKACLYSFAFLLVTSTLVYFLLYIAF
ncbi:hypothetical protein MNBD_NITROSPINAE01-1964 [hydrothermal vent metagenome]|uniref:DUF420 domain-containing protein n=1 Tax=hydrothermal vent metagenome TaxID=652676 RepID=A0A3B1BL08_9ZZZZ